MAADNFGRFLTGQMTAAGRVQPAKMLVIGGGVAGLSAMATAHSMGAIVRGFDTRPAVQEQVESLGAEFLKLDFKEDGTGVGGYAKEMSKEFHEAEVALFAQQCKEVDIIISTALIPGKPAPKLITRDMVASMKQGSVTVDLAAEAGGNIETTVPGELVRTENGVTCIGYTDLPSRLATQSSTLYANNVSRFFLSMTSSGTDSDAYFVNEEDEVVRGALVLHDGAMMWPPPPPPQPVAPPPQPAEAAAKVEEIVVSEEERMRERADAHYAETRARALTTTAALSSFLALGMASPNPAFSTMASTFSLAGIVGYQVVWGVQHSLHSPLMSVTNAISGLVRRSARSRTHGEW